MTTTMWIVVVVAVIFAALMVWAVLAVANRKVHDTETPGRTDDSGLGESDELVEPTMVRMSCNACDGSGYVPMDDFNHNAYQIMCTNCHGTGYVRLL